MSDPAQSGGAPGRADGDPAAMARALLEATFAGDHEAATKCCTPDVELRIEGTQTLRGYEGLQHMIDFIAEVATNIRVTIHHTLGNGDTVAINRTVHLTIDGRDLVLEVGAFFEMRDGLVCRWTDYQDMRIVTEALGH